MKWYAITRKTPADVAQRYDYATVRNGIVVWVSQLKNALHFDNLLEAKEWKRNKGLIHKNFGIVEFEISEISEIT